MRLERAVERIGAAYAEHVERGETEDANAVREVLVGKRAERDRAELRLQAAETGLADVAGDDEPIDPLLDFYSGLREALSGRVADADGDVRRLNAAMRDYFQRVELRQVPEGVAVVPVLSASGIERVVRAVLEPEDAEWALGGHQLKDDEIHGECGPPGVLARPREAPPLREIRARANPQPPS